MKELNVYFHYVDYKLMYVDYKLSGCYVDYKLSFHNVDYKLMTSSSFSLQLVFSSLMLCVLSIYMP